MLEINDKTLLFRIVAETIADVHLTITETDRRNRTINAIAKATTVLEGDLTFFHWDPFEETLHYWSPDSGEIYVVTAHECQCPAFRQNLPQPCYHRAMRLLVSRYCRREDCAPAQVDFADAVFFDAEMNAREKVSLLRDAILEGRAELKPRIEALEKFIARNAPSKSADAAATAAVVAAE